MPRLRVPRLAALAPSLVIALIPPQAALAACDGAVYRVEMSEEAGGSWSARFCGREGYSLLVWANVQLSDRSTLQPTGDLGPRYVLVVERLRGGPGRAVARQDFYPLADIGPVVFAAPGQIFSHPAFGGFYTVATGWARVLTGGPIADRLRELGVPIPTPEPELPIASPSPRGSPSESAESGAGGPDIVSVVLVAALLAIGGLWWLRRER